MTLLLLFTVLTSLSLCGLPLTRVLPALLHHGSVRCCCRALRSWGERFQLRSLAAGKELLLSELALARLVRLCVRAENCPLTGLPPSRSHWLLDAEVGFPTACVSSRLIDVSLRCRRPKSTLLLLPGRAQGRRRRDDD